MGRPVVNDVQTRRARLDELLNKKKKRPFSRQDVEQIIHYAPTSDGFEVPIYHFWKKNSGSDAGPAIVHIHGGGYFTSSAAYGAESLAAFISQTGVPMLSIDYRLAPENSFPVPLEDCWSGLNWVKSHAEILSIDPSRIAVIGERAGSGLAAGLTLLLRDRGFSPP